LPSLSKEQIERARAWDLLSYLQAYEPGELVKSGLNEYSTRSHDSLKISHGKWCWNSRGIGGRSALDYLIKVRGLPFVDAVKTLCGDSPPLMPKCPPPCAPVPFTLPKASRFPSAVVAYLQERCIDPEIIGVCIEKRILYESAQYQNCVFVGRDRAGNIRSASLRGTRDRFKMDAAGSDKRFSFFLPAGNPDCPRLAVAESPIDALSLASLVKQSGENWRDSHYLSLGGTAPRALIQFLHDHPHVTQISLCLDNDKAGLDGMDRLEQAVRNNPALEGRIKLIYHNPPPVQCGKDYNDFLRTQIVAKKGKKRSISITL